MKDVVIKTDYNFFLRIVHLSVVLSNGMKIDTRNNDLHNVHIVGAYAFIQMLTEELAHTIKNI